VYKTPCVIDLSLSPGRKTDCVGYSQQNSGVNSTLLVATLDEHGDHVVVVCYHPD